MIFFFMVQVAGQVKSGVTYGSSKDEVYGRLYQMYRKQLFIADVLSLDEETLRLSEENKDKSPEWFDKNLTLSEDTMEKIEAIFSDRPMGYSTGAYFANSKVEIVYTTLEQALGNGFKPEDVVKKPIKYYVITTSGGFLGEGEESVPHISQARRFTHQPLCSNVFGVG